MCPWTPGNRRCRNRPLRSRRWETWGSQEQPADSTGRSRPIPRHPAQRASGRTDRDSTKPNQTKTKCLHGFILRGGFRKKPEADAIGDMGATPSTVKNGPHPVQTFLAFFFVYRSPSISSFGDRELMSGRALGGTGTSRVQRKRDISRRHGGAEIHPASTRRFPTSLRLRASVRGKPERQRRSERFRTSRGTGGTGTSRVQKKGHLTETQRRGGSADEHATIPHLLLRGSVPP